MISNELTNLLQQRLDWYSKLLSITRAFVNEFSVHRQSMVEELDYFLNNRQSLLSIASGYEKKITLLLESNKLKEMQGPMVANDFHDLVKQTDSMLQSIIKLDQDLAEILEQQRLAEMRKISSLRQGKKMISSYRSETLEGKNLDVNL